MTSNESAQDGLVMATNNSSIVSKRSVERLYYPEPHFFRYFVKKPQRRSPLINRGYWLRMRVIERQVLQFVKQKGPHLRTKVVINLGCGYDPLPFQFLAKQNAARRNAVFIDVDYEALMQTKRDVIVHTPQLYEILSGFHTTAHNKAVLLTSAHYTAIGCDLTDTTRLEAAIKSELALDNCDVLFLAEVSLTYMETSSADAVISWASKLTKSVQFCLLEQYLPGGADHPFAMTMLKHFEKVHAPLRSILQYPTLEKQLERFFESGWKTVRAMSLWECWQGSIFTSAERRQLDSVESFDEWEEFALFASHYFILEARSIGEPDSGWREVYIAEMQEQDNEELGTMPPVPEALSSLRLTYYEAPRVKGRRRYGAVLNQKDSVIGLHGGMGSQSRLGSTNVYGIPHDSPFELCLPPSEVSARMLHTITYLSDDECLLVGGRSSPDKAMADCWLRKMNRWCPISDLPTARYRHCAAKVSSLDGPPGVLVHGGKQNASHVLEDWLLWEPTTGWRYPGLSGQNGMLPAPRFSASLVCLEKSQGLLFGGISEDGRVLRDIWFWKLSGCTGRPLLEFQNHTKSFERHHSTGTHNLDGSVIDRFGAVTWPVKGGLTVVGGISTYGAHEICNEIVHIRFQKAVDGVHSRAALDYPYTDPAADVMEDIAMEDFRTTEGATVEQFGTNNAYEYISDRVSLLKWSTFCRGTVRPLLVGHAAVVADAKRIVIFGGGAVCFSFGTHWNEGTWSLHKTFETENRTPWVLLAADQEEERLMEPNHGFQHNSAQAEGHPRAADRIEVKSATEFDKLVAKSQPVILNKVDIGPCVNLWTVEYLRSEIGPDRIVVVHEGKSENMNFQTKNFKYVKKKFGDFLNQIAIGEKQYLRSISSDKPTETPANLERDFPEISGEFKLPAELAAVISNAHSSPLRISGPVAMWLHYDVMANVLCQIKGTKRVILYPPTDISALSFPPGASSSTIDVFEKGPMLENTHPVEAVLKQGDVLFIPPLWLHTASPTETLSIAVNVFFRNLTTGYAAGRDVYGNRDLAAYENGRRDVDRLAKNFKDLPRDLARFYLERLGDELKDRASTAGSS